MTDTGAKVPIESGMIARAIGALKVMTGKSVAVDNGTAFFGPLNPPQPIVTGESQIQSVTGRQFDYPTGYNLRQTPRSGDAVSFGQMRALADSCDILRLVIETRKDQIAKMKFAIKPRKSKKETDARCAEVEDFFQFPDGENNWNDWLRQLLEEMLVTDAATIYPWMTNGGTPYRMELMDGATIKRVIDARGRTPAAPMPAYQQILKGLTAIDYTADELIYRPRNKRVHKVYGYSPVEQIIMTINIALRRALHQLQFYTDGSTPDLLFQVPESWNMTQIKEFNDWWQDSLAGNTAQRRKAQFVPNGVTPINTKEAILKDPYDEWLARIICYAYGVSAQPFIKESNRSTAETAAVAALEEGLYPLMLWIKGTMDFIIAKYFGYADLEFAWEDQDATKPEDQNKMDDLNVKNGTATINEVRARRGDEGIGPIGDKPMVLLSTGYVPITGEPPPPPVAPTPPGTEPKKDEPPKDNEPEPTKKISKSLTFSKVQSKIKPIDRESKAHKAIENELAVELAKKLRELGTELANSVVSKLQKDDKITLDPDDPFNDVEWLGWDDIEDLFGEQLVLAGKLGNKNAYSQLDLDNPVIFELANEDAIAYAKERSAELVGKRVLSDGTVIENANPEYSIKEATREMIRGDITTALEQGLSNDELAAMLEENYAFSSTRADTIARTETALADVQGNLVVYRESNVVESKQWITGEGCCEECALLDGEIVGLGENFSDGTEAPPAHPNCRCDILPILSSEEDTE